jgi:hypothetical protein
LADSLNQHNESELSQDIPDKPNSISINYYQVYVWGIDAFLFIHNEEVVLAGLSTSKYRPSAFSFNEHPEARPENTRFLF